MSELNRHKILIAGHLDGEGEELYKLLSSEGYLVSCSDDVKSIKEKINESCPDAIIAEMTLTGEDQQTFAETIISRYPHIPVLVTTGYETLELARMLVKKGADDYIFKPLQKDEVLRRIRNSIEKAYSIKMNNSINNAMSLLQNDNGMDSSLKKENLYKVIVESALNQTHSSLGALVIYNEDKDRFEIAYSSYISEGNIYFPHDYPSYPVINFIISFKKPMLLTSSKKHPLSGRIQRESLSPDKFPEIIPFEKEAIIFPMTSSQSKVIGFIVLSKKKDEISFTAADLHTLAIIAGQSSVSVHNAYLVEGLERNYVNTLMALNAILEAKHPYTKGHTQRVTLYSTAMAREMSLSSAEIQIMRDGAMLHDIGKIGVADAILNKEGTLSDSEFNIIKKHPIIGEKIIKPIKFLERTLPIIRHHHERMDGRGWPDGLSGARIPLLVRICTIADAYDAMSSDRPYRETMNIDEIRRQLICHSGIQFDEELVDIFLRLLDRGLIPEPIQAEHTSLIKI